MTVIPVVYLRRAGQYKIRNSQSRRHKQRRCYTLPRPLRLCSCEAASRSSNPSAQWPSLRPIAVSPFHLRTFELHSKKMRSSSYRLLPTLLTQVRTASAASSEAREGVEPTLDNRHSRSSESGQVDSSCARTHRHAGGKQCRCLRFKGRA